MLIAHSDCHPPVIRSRLHSRGANAEAHISVRQWTIRPLAQASDCPDCRDGPSGTKKQESKGLPAAAELSTLDLTLRPVHGYADSWEVIVTDVMCWQCWTGN